MAASKKSYKTQANMLTANIEKMIKRVFNRDFFSLYDGVVEGIDTDNGLLTVRIPDLNNSLYEECQILLPCSTSASAVYPNFELNSTVIVGFKQFSLAHPVVLGGTLASGVSVPIESDKISMVNGTCKLTMNNNEIIISNGTSSIRINNDGIALTGTNINANGENLNIDDIGEI